MCKNSSDLLLLVGLVPVLLVLIAAILLIVMRKTCCFTLSVACAGIVGIVLSVVCMVLTLASLPNGTAQNEVKLLSNDAVATTDELMKRYLHGDVTTTVDLSGIQTDYFKFSPDVLTFSFNTLSELIE